MRVSFQAGRILAKSGSGRRTDLLHQGCSISEPFCEKASVSAASPCFLLGWAHADLRGLQDLGGPIRQFDGDELAGGGIGGIEDGAHAATAEQDLLHVVEGAPFGKQLADHHCLFHEPPRRRRLAQKYIPEFFLGQATRKPSPKKQGVAEGQSCELDSWPDTVLYYGLVGEIDYTFARHGPAGRFR